MTPLDYATLARIEDIATIAGKSCSRKQWAKHPWNSPVEVAAFIAISDPHTIAALIAELRRLRAENAKHAKLRADLAFAQSDLAVARVTIEAQAGADMERVRLRAEVETLRDDKARLDWIEAHRDCPFPINSGDGYDPGLGWEWFEHRGDTCRQCIDAARRARVMP